MDNGTRRRLLTGLGVVVVGLLLLLDTTGILETTIVFTFVPSVVIAIGLYLLVRHRLRHVFGPGLIVLVGIAWQLSALEYASFGSLVGTYWPLVIVLFGLSMILRRVRTPASIRITNEDDPDLLAIFGETERRYTGVVEEIDGTAVFGTVSVDLSEAQPAQPVTVDAVAVFGEIDVRVPDDWDVRLEIDRVLGEVSDDRIDHPRRDEPDCIVSGSAIFGDVTVRS